VEPGNAFICYRREDTAADAGRIHDRLGARFPGRVFMDVTGIEPGVDFVEAIERAVSSCAVCLAIIGPRWLATRNEQGGRRIDDPNDFVRLELGTALKRNVRVIPVLVGGARMPAVDELPPDLQPLARRNAIQIDHAGFDQDVRRLGDSLERALDSAAQRPGERRPGARLPWAIAVAGVALLAVLGIWFWPESTQGPPKSPPSKRVDSPGTEMPGSAALREVAEASMDRVAVISAAGSPTASGFIFGVRKILLTGDFVAQQTRTLRARIGGESYALRLIERDTQAGLTAFELLGNVANLPRGLAFARTRPANAEDVVAVGWEPAADITAVPGRVQDLDPKFIEVAFAREKMVGFGGCPVLNASGRVVGILHSGRPHPNREGFHLNYCIRSDVAAAFLRRVLKESAGSPLE
jgi:hypothetical protein